MEGDEGSKGRGDASVSASPLHQMDLDYSLLLCPSPVPFLTSSPPNVTTDRPPSLMTPPGFAATPTISCHSPWSQSFIPQTQILNPGIINPSPIFDQWPRTRHPLPPMSIAPRPNIWVLPEVYINAEVWAKALMAISYDDDGRANLKSLIGAGKIIFNSLFTDEEVKSCTVSGREGRPILDPRRCRAIKVAVAWMKLNKVNGVDPYAFNPTDPDHHLTPEENEQIHKKVFIQRRSDQSRKQHLKLTEN